jgi:hypothetical protein
MATASYTVQVTKAASVPNNQKAVRRSALGRSQRARRSTRNPAPTKLNNIGRFAYPVRAPEMMVHNV